MKKILLIIIVIALIILCITALHYNAENEFNTANLIINILIAFGTIGTVIVALWDKLLPNQEKITGKFQIIQLPDFPKNTASNDANSIPTHHQCAILLELTNKSSYVSFFRPIYGVTVKNKQTGEINHIPLYDKSSKDDSILPPHKKMTVSFIPMLPFEIINESIKNDNVELYIYTAHGNDFPLTKAKLFPKA